MTKLAAVAALLAASSSVALAQAPAATTTTTTTTTIVCTGDQCVTSTGAPVVVSPAPAPAPTMVAVAAPSAAPAAAAASAPPQTHDWKDVNHINGQLVKVGESNDYLKSYKRWNISANPVGMMMGFYGLSVSYGLNNNVALRGDVNYMKPFNEDVEGVEVGVGVPIYFRRTYQGLFLEPGFISRTFSESNCFDCREGETNTTTTFGPQVLVGWHWTWDTGMNFAMAAGAGRDWSTQDSEYDDEEPFVNGYMRFGYAF